MKVRKYNTSRFNKLLKGSKSDAEMMACGRQESTMFHPIIIIGQGAMLKYDLKNVVHEHFIIHVHCIISQLSFFLSNFTYYVIENVVLYLFIVFN